MSLLLLMALLLLLSLLLQVPLLLLLTLLLQLPLLLLLSLLLQLPLLLLLLPPSRPTSCLKSAAPIVEQRCHFSHQPLPYCPSQQHPSHRPLLLASCHLLNDCSVDSPPLLLGQLSSPLLPLHPPPAPAAATSCIPLPPTSPHHHSCCTSHHHNTNVTAVS